MAEGHRAAVRVRLRHVKAQGVDAGEGLGGKGLVDFDDVHILDLHAHLLHHLGHGVDGAEAHDGGVAPGDGKALQLRDGLDAQLLGEAGGHDDHIGRGVGGLGGGGGGHGAVLAEAGLH